jgi:hypothetical protein
MNAEATIQRCGGRFQAVAAVTDLATTKQTAHADRMLLLHPRKPSEECPVLRAATAIGEAMDDLVGGKAGVVMR